MTQSYIYIKCSNKKQEAQNNMFTVISILDIPLYGHFKVMACTINVTISHSQSYTFKRMWWKAMLNSDVDGLHSILSGFEFVAHTVQNEVKPFMRSLLPTVLHHLLLPCQKPLFPHLFVQLVV